MNEETKNSIETDAKKVSALISKAAEVIKKARNKDEDLILATEINESLLVLGSHLLKCEQQYQFIIKDLEAAGKSNSSAEAEAKTKQEYYLFKRCKQIFGIGEEQVRILKKAAEY